MIQINTITVKGNTEIPKEIILNPTISLLSIYSKDIKRMCPRKNCNLYLIASLILVGIPCNQAVSFKVSMNLDDYIYTIRSYLDIAIAGIFPCIIRIRDWINDLRSYSHVKSESLILMTYMKLWWEVWYESKVADLVICGKYH